MIFTTDLQWLKPNAVDNVWYIGGEERCGPIKAGVHLVAESRFAKMDPFREDAESFLGNTQRHPPILFAQEVRANHE